MYPPLQVASIGDFFMYKIYARSINRVYNTGMIYRKRFLLFGSDYLYPLDELKRGLYHDSCTDSGRCLETST